MLPDKELPAVGDVIEQDGQQYRVTDIRSEQREDGTTVTVMTLEPVV